MTINLKNKNGYKLIGVLCLWLTLSFTSVQAADRTITTTIQYHKLLSTSEDIEADSDDGQDQFTIKGFVSTHKIQYNEYAYQIFSGVKMDNRDQEMDNDTNKPMYIFIIPTSKLNRLKDRPKEVYPIKGHLVGTTKDQRETWYIEAGNSGWITTALLLEKINSNDDYSGKNNYYYYSQRLFGKGKIIQVISSQRRHSYQQSFGDIKEEKKQYDSQKVSSTFYVAQRKSRQKRILLVEVSDQTKQFWAWHVSLRHAAAIPEGATSSSVAIFFARLLYIPKGKQKNAWDAIPYVKLNYPVCFGLDLLLCIGYWLYYKTINAHISWFIQQLSSAVFN